MRTFCEVRNFASQKFPLTPMSREISDLSLLVSYFASQSKGIKCGDYYLTKTGDLYAEKTDD